MIEKVREYIAKCPHLDEFVSVNVNYLVDKAKAYSVNEGVGYNPVLKKDIIGNEECQFQFMLDAKLYWNEEVANNIDNSVFFEKFSNWLRENNKKKIFPQIEGIEIETIGATTNGYIFATNTDEAIYRISCVMKYFKEK